MRLAELLLLVALAIGADRLFPDAAGWSFWAIGLTIGGIVYYVMPRALRRLRRGQAPTAPGAAKSSHR